MARKLAEVLTNCISATTSIRRDNQAVVGVDLGVSAWATLSSGENIVGPTACATAQKPRRRVSKQFSRQTDAANAHAGIANLRANAWHLLTTRLVERFGVMAIEDLNVAGMAKNHHRARAIADRGFGEFRRQIEDQAAPEGTTVIVGNCWYPSSNTCSACGYQIPKMLRSVREWTSAQCQTHHNRDIDAAIHWQKVAETSFTASPEKPWCDEPGRRRQMWSEMIINR